MDINSKGKSVHELVSALQGKADLDMEDVSLPRKFLDYLSTDVEEQAATSDDGDRIEIDGAFSFDFGSETGLVAEAIHVATDDGVFGLTLGKLEIQPDLAAYLEKGKLWIHHLSIADLHAEITTIGAWEEHELPEHDWQRLLLPNCKALSSHSLQPLREGLLWIHHHTEPSFQLPVHQLHGGRSPGIHATGQAELPCGQR